jgi:hypothetical protein
MKHGKHIDPETVLGQSSEDVRALDQSEKEYNRMISRHMMYHKMLMDDLMKLSSESGSGSGSGSATTALPQELLQQQLNQANQANIVGGLGTTIDNMNANRDQLMKSASKYAGDSSVNAQTVARLNNFIQENATTLVKKLAKSPQNEHKEGFTNPGPNHTLDGALEVSQIMRESHKYALVIFGIFAMYLLHKTIKNL